MTSTIAISGMACRFPDADSPTDLWRNVLSQRRAFRRIPRARLNLDDYFHDDPAAPDRTYSVLAAVLDGWEFDRVRFRIAGSTFRSTDLAHWLALDVAADALTDASWEGHPLPRHRTGVLVGNTLTSEFARARLLRLRWPYARRTLAAVLAEECPELRPESLLKPLERRFKEPFPAIDEDALAGGLSNTIAGRICNAFDLGGGGYTVDGACASSLLAVVNACAALDVGDLDVALAGGVDLSLDPFELVGFAKAGALARDAMRVYDARPQGFWPGEGCGFVVLERLDRLRARGGRAYAVIKGWGVSSDGSGGITRPTVDGELRALRAAYARARLRIRSIDVFEGHGTGTEIGDRTELSALDAARREDGAAQAAAIGSVKANIGHTKAAAGLAGLIKATLSLHERVIPPTTACEQPHELLRRHDRVLRDAPEAEAWPHSARGHAGVSAFGFGGINCHVVLEGPRGRRRLGREERRLAHSAQDAELVLLAAEDDRTMRAQLDRLSAVAEEISLAELGDLAAALHRTLPIDGAAPVRAAVVASTPAELATGIDRLADALPEHRPLLHQGSIFLGREGVPTPRIGLLFPGQASPTYLGGGALARRFEFVEKLTTLLPSRAHDPVDTAVAQPAIVGCELMGLELLRRLGVNATVSVGHSVGELTALHWAGALQRNAVMDLVRARGAAIARHGAQGGAMASLRASIPDTRALIDGEPEVVIAADNGPSHTVVAGPDVAVHRVLTRAARARVTTVALPVSHAFHSPLVAAAAAVLEHTLSDIPLAPIRREVISTVTGAPLASDADVPTLLIEQLTKPVRFGSALTRAAAGCDLLLEVGPGSILTHLAHAVTSLPVFPLDVGGTSLRPLLSAVAALFAAGARPRLDVLFADRFTRPFDVKRQRAFLANPCEPAPSHSNGASATSLEVPQPPVAHDDDTATTLVRRLVARRAELPESAVGPHSRLLDDLHLTSIAVGELAAEAAHALGIAAPVTPTELADATVAELAAALEASQVAGTSAGSGVPDAVEDWFRMFVPALVPRPAERAEPAACAWRLIAPDEHPLRAELERSFAGDRGEPALLVCVPPHPDVQHAVSLLDAAHELLRSGGRRCAFLHNAGGVSGFAKSLHLEHPDVDVAVIDAPLNPGLLSAVRRAAEAARGFCEVVLDSEGGRRVPVLRPWPFPDGGAWPLTEDDMILASGGGKGIGAECALALARATGARIALLGRSDPSVDAELRENLARFDDAGVDHRYYVADVADRQAVDAAVGRARRDLGEPTAILHTAGVNRPTRIDDLDDDELVRTLQTKVAGLRHMLGATREEHLRLLVTFGSIIGRTGLRGEAHYALANESLAGALADARARLPSCRCVNIEWTVWSGAGMAERLGTVAALAQGGISPLPLDEGVRILQQLVRCPTPPQSVVVAGRFGLPPTIELESRDLPLLRFLEHTLVHYPSIELVVEAKLSHGSDPYLADHLLNGSSLLPAVVGLEAMASVAVALRPDGGALTLIDARFERPVTVPIDGDRTIRLAGLVRQDGSIRVVIRSEETGFQAEHFSVIYERLASTDVDDALPAQPEHSPAAVALDPEHDLYGQLLFQGPRFRRVRRYRSLRARSCVADVVARNEHWFGPFLPQNLVIGDPGAHDAIIHAIQACIPHARLLPVAVERITFAAPLDGHVTVHARERWSDGERFVYDVAVADSAGRLGESWDGVTLHRIADVPRQETWPPGLLVPYLERRIGEHNRDLAPQVALIERDGPRRTGSDDAIAATLAHPTAVRRRSDGRPEISDPTHKATTASTSHLDGYTLALTGKGRLGCDVEQVVHRQEGRWADLLGRSRFELARLIAAETGAALDIEATRTWAAVECLKKAGLAITQPLKLDRCGADGWVVLKAGATPIATFVARLATIHNPVAIALLIEAR